MGSQSFLQPSQSMGGECKKETLQLTALKTHELQKTNELKSSSFMRVMLHSPPPGVTPFTYLLPPSWEPLN